MEAIKNCFLNLKNKLDKLTTIKYFDELYVGVITIIALFGWVVSTGTGMSLLILTAIIMIIFTMDLKYIIPQGVFFIFTISAGFSGLSFPIGIIIMGTIFAIVLFIYLFKKGIHLSKMKSGLFLLGLAIMNFIPIFWADIPLENQVFYFFFFANLGYLLLYVIMVNGIGKNSLNILSVTFSYLALLLAFECIFSVISLRNTVSSIFDLWYYMGWGLCNEAGIMICMSIPFTFYLIGKSKDLKNMLPQIVKLGISLIGLFLTMSRGCYLFGFGETIILAIILLFYAENKKDYLKIFKIAVVIGVIGIIALSFKIIPMIQKILVSVFKEGLDSNGRDYIWEKGINAWKNTPLTVLFGPGFCCVINERVTATGDQLSPLVFHSTLVQTLAMGGIFGLICLVGHMILKYRNLFKLDKLFAVIIGVGYIVVDIYGLIDNTYHMYYYMLPLMIILACVDSNIDDSI